MPPVLIGGEPIREEPLPLRPRAKACAGFVLIGGPGQGKSALGQPACQAHRAALLVAYKSLLTTQERGVLAEAAKPTDTAELLGTYKEHIVERGDAMGGETIRTQRQLFTRSVAYVGLSYDAVRFFVPPRLIARFGATWPAPRRADLRPPSRSR